MTILNRAPPSDIIHCFVKARYSGTLFSAVSGHHGSAYYGHWAAAGTIVIYKTRNFSLLKNAPDSYMQHFDSGVAKA